MAGRLVVAPDMPSSLNIFLHSSFFNAASCKAGSGHRSIRGHSYFIEKRNSSRNERRKETLHVGYVVPVQNAAPGNSGRAIFVPHQPIALMIGIVVRDDVL
jgi:hypothetical protein